MKNEDMLTTKEAAEYIRFAESTLTNWRVRSEGPKHSMISGKVFYFKDDLDKWILEQRKSTEYGTQIKYDTNCPLPTDD